MNRFDHSDLDGHLLMLFVAVFEEGSITRAAQRLGLTQSAVSHLLDKLRVIVGDPLFVRSGRGIVATARAEVLAQKARLLIDDLRGFITTGAFDPSSWTGEITIAANDLQRDLLLPALLRRARERAPGLRLRVIPSGVPSAEMLRDGGCQLVVSPRPPEAADLMQKRLFEDQYMVFYDASQRKPPRNKAEYLAAEHVTVIYEPRRQLDLDQTFSSRGIHRHIVASVPAFAGVAAFVRGSTLITTAPSLLRVGLLRDLAFAAPPLPCPGMPMYLIWHVRHQADPMHQWLRQEIEAVVTPALRRAGRDAVLPDR